MSRAKRLMTVMKARLPGSSLASPSLIEDAQSPGKGCQWGESNPLRVISVWFEGRPAELQADLASLVSTILPELVPGDVQAAALDEAAFFFRRAPRAEGELLLLAARAAALSAAIDLIFLQRSTQEGWLTYQERLGTFPGRDSCCGQGGCCESPPDDD